jgi:transposase
MKGGNGSNISFLRQFVLDDVPAGTFAIFNAILWVQQSGEKWHRLPATFPPAQTCYVKLLEWRRTGHLQKNAEVIDAIQTEMK